MTIYPVVQPDTKKLTYTSGKVYTTNPDGKPVRVSLGYHRPTVADIIKVAVMNAIIRQMISGVASKMTITRE